MAEENFVHKTLDKLLEVIEVEFKFPFVIGEVKFTPTEIAKEWRENKKKRSSLEQAIQRAEQKFVAEYKDPKVVRMLREFPLYSDEEFRKVIVGLLANLREENILWLAEIKVQNTWKNVANPAEIRKALELYLPYLRRELNTIKEFREIISSFRLERIEENTHQTVENTEKLLQGNETIKATLDDISQKITPQQSPVPSSPATPKWFFGHQYPDVAAFTGRLGELKMLDEWLGNKTESLLVVNAFGGFGKSALTWHWLKNHVDKATWSTAVWWSFYEKESGFESFLADTLTHLGMETKERSARQQVNDLLDAMQKTNILIVLDGFERLLRQYGRMDAALQDDEENKEIDPSQRDCTSQSAETFIRGLSEKKIISKVLMTSRLFPRALEGRDAKLQRGCREVELKGLLPADAQAYFKAEGISATRAEIIDVCSLYGYHPLSLTLLVGWINREDGNEHRGDIVEAKNLDIFDNIKARRDHVLERAYQSLAPERRDLLSKISCFRGSMEYAVLKKVFPSPDLDKALLDLRKRGLLQYAGETGRYDIHPIVRHYAYDHFTDEKRRKEAHVQLAMHFVDVMPVTKAKVKTLEDLTPVIELYHHLIGAGNLEEARKIFKDRLDTPTYYQFGAYQLQIELLRALFLDGEEKPPRLKREDSQGGTLNDLSAVYTISGQPRHAVPVSQNAILLAEKMGNKKNVAIGLGNVAQIQLVIGALSEAERNLFRSIDLCREIEDEFWGAVSHQELGRVLSYRGAWQEAEQELDSAIAIQQKIKQVQTEGLSTAYHTLRFLLMARANHQSPIENLKSSIKCAQRALELADEDARIDSPTPRDYIRAYWLLGSAHRANNELTLAEENLPKALNLCRQINSVDHEANILLDLARLRYDQKNFEEAKSLADEALTITERCGYVLQGADVNLFLAQYALEQELDKAKAKQYAEEAKKLATCDGPPYYYKVAYEEAERMLEKLK